MTTTERLRSLCDEHGLKAADVAKLMDRSVFTVRHWFSGTHYQIPESMLELLEFRLAKQAANSH